MNVQYTVLHPQLCGQGVDLVLAEALEAAEADTWARVGTLFASRLIGWPATISWPAIVRAVVFAGIVGLVFRGPAGPEGGHAVPGGGPSGLE